MGEGHWCPFENTYVPHPIIERKDSRYFTISGYRERGLEGC